MSEYYEKRKQLKYYKFIRCLLGMVCCGGANSILDVGSCGTDLISFLPIKEKVSIDLSGAFISDDVLSIKGDFREYDFHGKCFDIVTCFQVLEHIDDKDVAMFARKLLNTSRVLIVSVPYLWKKGACQHHLQDPVDIEKVVSWFGQEPIFLQKINDGANRIIAAFVNSDVTDKINILNGGEFRKWFNYMSETDLTCDREWETIYGSNLSSKSQYSECTDGDIKNFVKNGNTYIFGNGVWGKALMEYCKQNDIQVKSYVVSDKYYNDSDYENGLVQKLSSLDLQKDKLIIATSKRAAYDDVYMNGYTFMAPPFNFFREICDSVQKSKEGI